MTKIKFKETVLGTHYYSDAPEMVEFLQHEHHHDFTITVQCDVKHDDRDLEWIMLRIELKRYIRDFYTSLNEIVRFGGRSCEMISEEVKDHFEKLYPNHEWKVSVSEDNIYEGGDW